VIANEAPDAAPPPLCGFVGHRILSAPAMTLQEAEAEVAKLKAIAEALLESPSAARATALRNECRRSHQLMRRKFGNVVEKIAKLESAATAYTRHHVDVSGARHGVARALASIEIALELHRLSPEK
jgi:hypothetical protein